MGFGFSGATIAEVGELAFKMILSIILGGLIGIEREKAHKPAGLRTNILVCLGSTIFMIIAIKTAEAHPGSPVDVTRVAAGIIMGIGFLGGGTILRTAKDVQGLTSAATIWFVCGVGMATGMGFYVMAGMAAVLGFLILKCVRYLGRPFE